MDLSMFINAALSAAGGGGVVGALVLALYKNSLKKEELQREAERLERKELSEKLEVLEKEKFADLKRSFDDHVKSAKAGEILVKLDLLTGSVQKLTDLTAKTLQLTASHEAKIAGHDVFLGNIDRVLQDHIKHQPGRH